MLTLALYGLLAVLLIGGIYLLAAWLLPAGEQIAPPVRDEPIWSLPAERALAAADVADVRLPVALRGYRFAETDLLLDRLVEELRARDEEIARLRSPRRAPAPALSRSLVRARLTGHGHAGAGHRRRRWKPASHPGCRAEAGADCGCSDCDSKATVRGKSRAEAKPVVELRPTPAADAAPAAEPKPAPADAEAPAAEPKPEPKPRRPAVRRPLPAPPTEHVEQGGHDG